MVKLGRRRGMEETCQTNNNLWFTNIFPTFPTLCHPGSNLNIRDQKLLHCNMRNAHTQTVQDSLLCFSYCHSACTLVYYIVLPIAYGNWPFPNTMMSCVEWKESSVPGLFHPFVWPTRAKGVTVKEVIFKCIYSAPSTPSTHLLLPSHQTVTTACLPILPFSISPINQQITAVTAAHCFAGVNSLKWILSGLA